MLLTNERQASPLPGVGRGQIELLAAVLEIISIYGRKAIIASPRIADIAPHLPSSIPKPTIAHEIMKPPPPDFEAVSLGNEIFSS